jgi:phosphoglycerol transferase
MSEGEQSGRDWGPFWRELGTCVLVAALSLLAVAVRLELWKADLRVPFQYGHDSFTNHLMIKTTVDCGWWMTNDYIGAPGRLEWHDYPLNPTLHMVIIKGLTLISSDPAVVLNVYFLLTFPLISLAAYAALRGMDVSRWPTVAVAVIYAFLHYHFWRNESHLYLAGYFMVPLTALLCVWLVRGEPILLERCPEGKLRLRLINRVTLLALGICLLAGLDFPYYPPFVAFFILAAGCLAAGKGRDTLPLWQAGGLIATVVLGLVVNLAPNIVYRIQNGRNPADDQVFQSRPWTDAEEYALKPVQLLLPAIVHPIKKFRGLRDKYYTGTKIQSEQDAISVGVCASLGLLVALTAVFWAQDWNDPRQRLYHTFGILCVAALLVGCVGGFSVLPSLCGFSVVRCFNRASVYIAFFGIATVAFLLDALARRWPDGVLWRGGAALGLVSLTVLAILDQVTVTYHQPYETTAAAFRNDREFVREVEQSAGPGAMVWQMPYVSFLSYRNAEGRMDPYSHFRGYFHSEKLRWSYGTMHGRPAQRLHAAIAKRPLEEQLKLLSHLGFAGIYVDRHGYKEGEEVEEQLRHLLGVAPIVSADGRLAYYSMRSYQRGDEAELSAWAREVLGPLEGAALAPTRNGGHR